MSLQTTTIETEKDYHEIKTKVEEWRKKGEDNLSDKKIARLHSYVAALKQYEKKTFLATPRKTLEDLLSQKMYERKLNQKLLATLLGLSESKLSQIISGKRKADVAFLKAVHRELGIDGNTLLESI